SRRAPPRWRAGRGSGRCADARATGSPSARGWNKLRTPQPPLVLPRNGTCRDSVTQQGRGALKRVKREPGMIEATAMKNSAVESRWLPILLAVLAADVNFWYWASTGENDADYLGIALFLIFGVLWARRLFQRPSPRNALAAAGAFLAAAAM